MNASPQPSPVGEGVYSTLNFQEYSIPMLVRDCIAYPPARHSIRKANYTSRVIKDCLLGMMLFGYSAEQKTQLNNYKLHHKGRGNTTIYAGELNPGIYFYSLISNGQVVDTKRMTLTD